MTTMRPASVGELEWIDRHVPDVAGKTGWLAPLLRCTGWGLGSWMLVGLRGGRQAVVAHPCGIMILVALAGDQPVAFVDYL